MGVAISSPTDVTSVTFALKAATAPALLDPSVLLGELVAALAVSLSIVPVGVAPLTEHVAVVVARCPQKQVVDVDAGRVVTVVTDVESIRNGPEALDPDDSMMGRPVLLRIRKAYLLLRHGADDAGCLHPHQCSGVDGAQQTAGVAIRADDAPRSTGDGSPGCWWRRLDRAGRSWRVASLRVCAGVVRGQQCVYGVA